LDVFENGLRAIEDEFLGEIAHPEASPPGEDAGIGGVLIGEDLEETGFPAAIAADKPDLFPGGYRQGDAVQEVLLPIGKVKISGGDEGGNNGTHGGWH
jgi:hypothetical protein